MKKELLSKKTKLLLVGIAVIFLFSLISLYNNWQSLRLQEIGYFKRIEAGAKSVSDSIGAQFFERYGDVLAFAASVEDKINNKLKLRHLLNKYVELYKIYDLLLIVDQNGRYLASNSLDKDGNAIELALLEKTDFKNEEWFKKVIQEQFTEDSQKGLTGVYVNDVQVDALSSLAYKSKRYGNSFSAPIRNRDGKIIAILTNRANFAWVENDFIRIYKNLIHTEDDTLELTLLNRDGKIIVDYDPHSKNGDMSIHHDFDILTKFRLTDLNIQAATNATMGKSGALIEMHARKKVMQLSGYSPIRSDKFIDNFDWSILVRVNEDQVFAQLNRSKLQFSISTVLFLLVLIGTAVFFIAYASEKDRQESTLRESSKMVALGEMAGGVAHEINNPLAIIRTKASQLRRLISSGRYEPGQTTTFLQEIENTTIRMSKIIDGLRTFSRSSADESKSLISLNKILDDINGLCQERLKNHGVKLEILNPFEVELNCKPVQIEQILINLVNNAFDAIQGTENPWIQINTKMNINSVEVSVTDSGSGIPEKIAAKLMQPFFTTKPVGKGTGLGLSISVGIAQSHGGNLLLNRESKNTQFILTLPLTENVISR